VHKNLVKIGHVVPEIWSRTNTHRQTDTHRQTRSSQYSALPYRGRGDKQIQNVTQQLHAASQRDWTNWCSIFITSTAVIFNFFTLFFHKMSNQILSHTQSFRGFENLRNSLSPNVHASLYATEKIKVKVAHTRLPSVVFRSWSRFLAVSLQVTWVVNPEVGCYYFPPGPQLPSQPSRGLLPISLLGEQRHDEYEQFALRLLPDCVVATIWI